MKVRAAVRNLSTASTSSTALQLKNGLMHRDREKICLWMSWKLIMFGHVWSMHSICTHGILMVLA